MEKLTNKLMGDNNGNLPEYKQLLRLAMKHVIPRFENTRRVKIQDLPGGEYVLVCDCKIFTKYGHGCRHVYRLLKRRPLSANIDAGSDDESDGSDDWATDVFDPSTADPYNNFMHMYQHCTKYAKAHGKAGQDILNAGFRKIRKELSALGGDKPLIKHARGHKRKTKPGSPGRSTRKKRPHK